MIFDIFLFIIGGILKIISFIFSLIEVVFPDYFVTAVTNYMGYLRYAQGFLPIVPDPTMTGLAHDVGLLTILGWVITLLIGIYSIKVLLKLLGLIPFLHIRSSFNKNK